MKQPKINRRSFLQTTSATLSLAVPAVPAVHTLSRTDALFQDEVITGQDELKFRVNHDWAKLPGKFNWQTTSGIAVDSQNNVYVIHEGRKGKKNHPAIFVFDPNGKYIRAFGGQFAGGGHGLEIRQEGSEEFIYVAAYQGVKAIAKLTTHGEIVWYQKAPMESGLYAENEHLSTKKNSSRKGFLPTNFAFLDDGEFLLADGYGTNAIHHYDAEAKWKGHFGGFGDGKGKFKTSHGLWIDDREGREKSIVVTDRARNSLQYLTLDGKYIETLEGFALPANIDIRGDLMLVPELKARIKILNSKNEVVSVLGEAQENLKKVQKLREKPEQWKPGEFVHPHDACFDNDGNIYVTEWVKTGRLTKLTKV